jgi:hypothetical protein
MCAHFIALQISLLVNLVLTLCIAGEFNINITCMFSEFGVKHGFNKCEIIMSLLDKFNESKEVSSKLFFKKLCLGIQLLVFKVLMCLVFFYRFLGAVIIQRAKKGVGSQRKTIKIG